MQWRAESGGEEQDVSHSHLRPINNNFITVGLEVVRNDSCLAVA